MAPPELPARVVETLRCQQTLGPLEQREDGLWSPAAELLYPVRDGIVFMGFDERETQWMQETMEEERLWQGTPASVQQDLEYLRGSAPGLVDVINLIDKLGAVPDRRRLIDVGSGSGWGSRLFAEAGYDPWMVDFEPNSLWLGGLYAHPSMGPGKRVVADASLMPFADGTFDIALVKEFAHHVDDKDRLFAEVNRVLRPGGMLVLIEPTHSLWVVRAAAPRPGPRRGAHAARDHLARDLPALHRSQRPAHVLARAPVPGHGRELKITQTIKERAMDAVRTGKRTRDPVQWLHEHVAGGEATWSRWPARTSR